VLKRSERSDTDKKLQPQRTRRFTKENGID
jgi:hypothetical protein